MENGIYIEEALLDVLKETDLLIFERKLCVELQLMRLEHFDHVTDDELKSYTGLSQPAIRRLRSAIAEKKKKQKKAKGLFSTLGRKEDRDIKNKVFVPSTTIPSTNPVAQTSEQDATCLITKDQIKLMERLGEGSFAIVKRAIWTRSDGMKVDVAVKILRDATAEVIEDLQTEVNNMQKLQHPYLIRLYGIVFSNPAMMVVEFCDGGSLVDRLRSTNKPVPLVSVLLDYAQQISKGMAYLESKHCVHRDLAARNVLLADNEQTIKICDFGLMRALEDNERLYVMSAQKKVPFAWCPPESLRKRQFSHASDVWAFGVTLWEMFSYGDEPWAGCRGAEVLTKTEAGERLSRPLRCSNEIYDLMSSCWLPEAEDRPRFSLLRSLLSDIKFMIAEAREECSPTQQLSLELKANDRVIVIDGSGSVWFGQNVRTRNFGRFARSSIHVKSERNPTNPADTSSAAVLSPLSSSTSNRMEMISKPIPGSFIHACHGDINPDQSWGQPERIDDIYLKNPILRQVPDTRNGNARILGPQMITSIIDMHPSARTAAPAASDDNKQSFLKKPKPSIPTLGPNSGGHWDDSAQSRPQTDPFSPFSDYEFDVAEENIGNMIAELQQQSQQQPSVLDSDHPCASSQSSHETASAQKATSPTTPQPIVVAGGQVRKPTALIDRETLANALASLGAAKAVSPKSARSNSFLAPRASTSTASVTPAPPIPPQPVMHHLKPTPQPVETDTMNSKKVEYNPLPRPMRSSPDLTNMSGGSSTSRRQPPGSTPPPIQSSNFVNQHPSSTSALTTPLGNITGPPASIAFNANSANNERLLPNSALSRSTKSQNISAPALAGNVSSASANSTNFRASVYLAATAREAHAAKSQSADNNNGFTPLSATTPTMPQPSVPAGTSSNGEAAVYKETVFGVKLRPVTPAKTPTEPSISVTNSQSETSNVPADPVIRIRSSALKQAGIDRQTDGIGQGECAQGPDPFEIPTTVKRIANRNRYSQLLAEEMKERLALSSGAFRPQSVATTTALNAATSVSSKPLYTNPQPRSAAEIYASSSGILPPPSALLLGAQSSTTTAKNDSTTVNERSSSAFSSDQQERPQSQQFNQYRNQYAPLYVTSKTVSLASQNVSLSHQPIAVMQPSNPNSHIFYLPQQRTLTHRDSTPFLEGYARPSFFATPAIPSTSAMMGGGMTQTPQYGRQPLANIATGNNTVGALSRPTLGQNLLASDSQRSNTYSTSKNTPATTSSSGILQPTRSSPPAHRTSSMSDEILGLFDPLSTTSSSNQPSASSSSEIKTNNLTKADAIETVVKNALFAGREKCVAMLAKCNNDVEQAIRELKTDELISMGLTNDRSQALSALNDCRWDMNAAAAALLT